MRIGTGIEVRHFVLSLFFFQRAMQGGRNNSPRVVFDSGPGPLSLRFANFWQLTYNMELILLGRTCLDEEAFVGFMRYARGSEICVLAATFPPVTICRAVLIPGSDYVLSIK